MKPFNIAAAVALSLACAPCLAVGAPRAEPSATARLSGDSMALGAGYGWGRGVLYFKGRRTPFTVTGVTLVGIGADRLDGAAEVYNLKRIEDFSGLYGVAGRSGSFIAVGGGTAVLRNAKGVEVRLRTRSKGLKIALAAGGVNIQLR